MPLSRRARLILVEALVLVCLVWMNRGILDDLRQHADLSTGRKSPVVVVDVWGDFQCAECRRFARDTLPALQDAFVSSGRAVLVWHNAPLLGPDSVRAAEAVDCANDQHQFWAFHHALFSGPPGIDPEAFDVGRLEQTAAALGLDQTRFAACLEGGAHRAEVSDELVAARQLGITLLPTVFVDNQRVDGSPGFLEVSAMIERHADDGTTIPAPEVSRLRD